MGMPKRFAVFGVGSFRVSGQKKQNLSKVDKIFGPVSVRFREVPLSRKK